MDIEGVHTVICSLCLMQTAQTVSAHSVSEIPSCSSFKVQTVLPTSRLLLALTAPTVEDQLVIEIFAMGFFACPSSP